MAPDGTLNAEIVPPIGENRDLAKYGNRIMDIVLGPKNDMWFSNEGENYEKEPLVGYATPSGVTHEFPITAPIFSAKDLALGPDDTLWYTANEDIGRIKLPEEVDEFRVPPEEGDLQAQEEGTDPVELTVGTDGNIWFTNLAESETGQNYIGMMKPAGVFQQWKLPSPFRPTAIATGADGSVWFTEYPNAIGRLSPSGELEEFSVPSVSGYGNSLVLGPDGNMWFTEADNALGRITVSGDVTSFGPVLAQGETPARLTADADGHLWYSQAGVSPGNVSHLGRLTVPLAPVDQELPAVSGVPAVGQTLTASGGSWLHEPSAIEYQWQACEADGSNCEDLAGQTAATHSLLTGEAGDTIRVVVTAHNLAGAVSAPSEVSAVVADPPSPPPLSSRIAGATVAAPPPELPSSAKLYFERYPRFLLVEKATVAEAPRLGWIEFRCHGRRCPFSRRRIAVTATCRKHACSPSSHGAETINLLHLSWPFGRRKRLPVGTMVTVDIGEAGWIGKSIGLVVRYRHVPTLVSNCLEPNSDTATNEC